MIKGEYEGQTITERLKTTWKLLKTLQTSPKYPKKIQSSNEQGNVNGALKLLTKSMSNGILQLSDKTLDLMKQKHSGEPKKSLHQ